MYLWINISFQYFEAISINRAKAGFKETLLPAKKPSISFYLRNSSAVDSITDPPYTIRI